MRQDILSHSSRRVVGITCASDSGVHLAFGITRTRTGRASQGSRPTSVPIMSTYFALE